MERAGGYSRASFFADRTFPSLAIMRQQAARWSLDVAGQRVHGTTGQKPLEAFLAREQSALLPLPPKAWEPVRWTTAKVHADCHLQVERACERALDAGDGRYRTVRGILERGADQLKPDDGRRTVSRSIGAFLRGPAAFAHSLLEAQ